MAKIITVTTEARHHFNGNVENYTNNYSQRNKKLTELYNEGYELVTSIAATDHDGEIRRIVDTLVKRL